MQQYRDAHFREHGLDELASATVAVCGGHNVASLRDQGQEHRRGSAHPGGGQQRGLRTLELTEATQAHPQQ